MLHCEVAFAGQSDRKSLGLLARQVENIQVPAIFKADRIRPQAWPHHIEIRKVRELLNLLAPQVIAIQIQAVLGAAIGREINRVPMPHRKCIGVISVRQALLENIVL